MNPKNPKIEANKWSFPVILATAGGLGYLPKAPGTFGSIPGVAFGAFLHIWILGILSLETVKILPLSGCLIALTIIAVSSLIAYWTILRTESLWDSHDDKRIVSDEVVGQGIAVAFFEPTFFNLSIGFLLFRLFDIWKPSIIGWADQKVPGAFGTLLDDIFAGIVAAVILGGVIHFRSV